MKRLPLYLALLLCAVALAQTPTPGTISVTSTVTAKSGTDATTAVTCVLSNTARPTIRTVCTIGTQTVLSQDATPAIGSTSGVVGSFTYSGNSVTWIVQQPTAGNLTWQVAANGTSQSGTF